jgi:hypothetical protein
MKSLNRKFRAEKSNWILLAHGRLLPAEIPASEREEAFLARPQEPLSDESETREDLKASPVELEYTRVQELVVWALIIAIMVMSGIVAYMLLAKVGT